MKMITIKRNWLFILNIKMHCYKCGNKLVKGYVTRVYNNDDPGYQVGVYAYQNKIGFHAETHLEADIQYRQGVYVCEKCNYFLSCDVQKQIKHLQKKHKNNIISSSELNERIYLYENILDSNEVKEQRLNTIQNKFIQPDQYCYKCGNKLNVAIRSGNYVLDGFIYKRVDEDIEDTKKTYTLFYDCYKCNKCSYTISLSKQEIVRKKQNKLNRRIIEDFNLGDLE